MSDWKLETDRLRLREMTPADLPALATILIDDEVERIWTKQFTHADCAEWIDRQRARYARDACGYWLCIDKHSSAVVGQAGVLTTTIDGRTEPGLGWMLAPAHRGRGYATEAARACIQWTFAHTSAPRVLAAVRPINAPSIRVAERLGMRRAWTTIHADLEHLIYVTDRPE